MKLNPDCVRDVLFAVENKDFNTSLTLPELCNLLPNHHCDEIHYCCIKLKEAGFLDMIVFTMGNATLPGIARIHELTFLGHEFLADIKSDNTWSKTKDIAKNVGSFSMHALKDIAISVVSNLINKQI